MGAGANGAEEETLKGENALAEEEDDEDEDDATSVAARQSLLAEDEDDEEEEEDDDEEDEEEERDEEEEEGAEKLAETTPRTAMAVARDELWKGKLQASSGGNESSFEAIGLKRNTEGGPSLWSQIACRSSLAPPIGMTEIFS